MPLDLRHVLVVSRDRELLESLTVPFAAAHYAVHRLAHVNTPSIDVFVQNVDALIVDLESDLGPEAGYRLSRLFRVAHVPCLAVTARNHAHQRVVALEAGAQAVLSRPLRVPELVARLNALLITSGSTRALAAQFIGSQIILDTVALILASSDSVIALTAQEMALFTLLGQSVNHVVNHELLCDRLGVRCDRPGLAAVRQTITRLRRKLGADTSGALLLVTDHQHGYSLVLHECQASAVTNASPGLQASIVLLGLFGLLQAVMLPD